MRSVYGKAMWDQRRSLPTWASAVAALVLLEAALWPSMESMTSLSAYLRELPAPLQELFSIEQMTTGRGFLNAELYTLVLPMMFLVYGISRGARMLAGEEEAGALDLLLATPVSTTRLLLEEAGALATGIAGLGGATLLATLAGSTAFGLGISVASAVAGAAAVTLLGLEFGAVALVAGALTGRRGWAMAVPAGLALAAYVLFVAGLFVEAFEGWRVLSPFHQALHAGPLAPELPTSFLWLALVPAALVLAAVPIWSRRDIGVAV